MYVLLHGAIGRACDLWSGGIKFESCQCHGGVIYIVIGPNIGNACRPMVGQYQQAENTKLKQIYMYVVCYLYNCPY